MFQAIEESNGSTIKRHEELFNSSHSSISNELENMNKQYQQQMEQKVADLEQKIKQKDSLIEQLSKKE